MLISTKLTRWSFLSVMGAVFLLVACQQPEATSVEVLPPVVQPPIPEANPELVSFEVDGLLGGRYQHPSGTSLCIPEGAFKTQDGKPVEGPVQLFFREFHDAASIFLAGIPMEYQDGHFTTAGSFELRAEQDGNPLLLAPDKGIDVRMASWEAGTDYDFFFLDEEKTRGWNYLGTSEPEVNAEQVALREKVEKMNPGLPFPLNRKYMAFNFEAILDVYYNNRVSRQQEEELLGKMEAYGLGWTKAQIHQQIEFRGKWIHASLMVWKNVSGKSFPSWTDHQWNGKLTQVRGNVYDYRIVNRKDSSQVFETRMLAVMPLKELFAFPPEKWKEDYQGALAAIEAERLRMEMMASVYRNFEINQLGIYNWDKFLKQEDRLILAADFLYPAGTNERLTEKEVVFITGDNKGIIKFPEHSWEAMALAPDEGGRIFTLLPGNRLAVYSAQRYQEVDFNGLRQQETPAYDFKLETSETVIRSEDDFRQLLEI
jgi:hypothetical protein